MSHRPDLFEIRPRFAWTRPRGCPWIVWEPHLLADGVRPRSEGLLWVRSDFEADGIHPAQNGEWKVRMLLLNYRWSVFAAMMKSLRWSPLILWVHQVTVTRPHSVSSAG
jgi:hypothetical protein